MKKTVRLISTLLVVTFLFGVITCAPFSVSAANVDVSSVSADETITSDIGDSPAVTATKEDGTKQTDEVAQEEETSPPVGEGEKPKRTSAGTQVNFEDPCLTKLISSRHRVMPQTRQMIIRMKPRMIRSLSLYKRIRLR